MNWHSIGFAAYNLTMLGMLHQSTDTIPQFNNTNHNHTLTRLDGM